MKIKKGCIVLCSSAVIVITGLILNLGNNNRSINATGTISECACGDPDDRWVKEFITFSPAIAISGTSPQNFCREVCNGFENGDNIKVAMLISKKNSSPIKIGHRSESTEIGIGFGRSSLPWFLRK